MSGGRPHHWRILGGLQGGAGLSQPQPPGHHQAEGDGGEGINHDELISPLLRRGRRITDDTRSSEESEESEEEGEGSDKPDPVAWSMPDGFTLGAEPSKLDASLVGKHIYMRWKACVVNFWPGDRLSRRFFCQDVYLSIQPSRKTKLPGPLSFY